MSQTFCVHVQIVSLLCNKEGVEPTAYCTLVFYVKMCFIYMVNTYNNTIINKNYCINNEDLIYCNWAASCV